MQNKESKYPKRPRQHVIGDRAVDLFKVRLPMSWAKNESQRDYGWDILVTVVSEDQVREDFFAQLKSSDNPDYIENNKYLGHKLKVTTVNWLIEKSMPSILCFCDTGNKNEPIYFVWLQDELTRINKENRAWRKQKYLTIHIPTSQILDKNFHNPIQQYVKSFHDALRISSGIGYILGPSFGFEKLQPLSTYTEATSKIVTEKVSSVMADVGLIDISEEGENVIIQSLGDNDKKRFKEIKKSSIALDSFRDNEAKEILDNLSIDIEKAKDNIRARFFNNKGVLALHKRDCNDALNYFSKAEALNPKERKYVTNALNAEFLIKVSENDHSDIELGDIWVKRLEYILKENENYPNAVFLKAAWVGLTKGAKEAERFLRKTDLWEKEPLRARCELAETYKDEGQWDEAISLLSEVKKISGIFAGSYWSLYGSTYLQKAFENANRKEEFVVYGPGPSQLDIKNIREAELCFINACKEFSSSGFPLISTPAVANLAIVQKILGKFADALHFCKSFLIHHPGNADVSGALAGIMMSKDHITETVKYSRVAYDANPNYTLAYKNFLISLHLAEESEQIINLVKSRESCGFTNDAEASLSFSIYAIALNEVGQEEKSFQKIQLMKKTPEMVEDAIVAEAVISQNNGASREEVANIYRKGIQKSPDSPLLITHLIGNLNSSNNRETHEIIELIKKVAEYRQLVPSEVYDLGVCYLTMGEYEDALHVFKEGEKRYPDQARFFYGQAIAYSNMGDHEKTYDILKKYLTIGKRDKNVLRNLATSAWETGRLDEAVQLFQRALTKAKKSDEKAELHHQLWELKRTGGYKSKELLRHVIQFGKFINKDTEEEAQFLMMAFLTPYVEETDEDIKKWNNEIGKRLQNFSENHPEFPHLRSFKIPDELAESEKGRYILSEIAKITLPHRLATAPFKLSSRSLPYPLVFRAKIFYNSRSTCDFWSECTLSNTFSHAIHIWYDLNPLDEEIKCLSKRSEVCVDLSALLTLAECDLLNILPKYFDLIIISHGTKAAISYELFSRFGVQPIAEKIERWRIENRSIIRIRGFETEDDEQEPDDSAYKFIPGALYDKKERTINQLFGDGVGESILISQKFGMPLYSDESVIRHEAQNNYSVNCFSTIALLKVLRKEGHLTIKEETRVLCNMIRKNFRVVPFDSDHLNCCLNEIINKYEKNYRKLPTENDLLKDDDMGTLLRQFNDPFFNEAWLANKAIDWWVSLIELEDFHNEIFITCMTYPCYALSMKTTGKVLTGINKYEQEDRIAHLLGYYLVRVCGTKTKPIAIAWSAIKSCCEKIFSQDEKKYARALYDFLPKWIVYELEKMQLTSSEKMSRIVTISSYLPIEDRTKIDQQIMRINPSFMSF